jgi:Mg-chelatase subunit ChlD
MGRSSRERVTYYDIPIWSDRVVFVIDLSESMQEPSAAGAGKTRAEQAQTELGEALDGMPDSSRYNVVRFHSRPEILSPRPLPPTRANRAASLGWIDAPGGATNLHGALEMAIRCGGGDTIFLLTDGAPSCGTFKNKTEILESVDRMTRFRKVRIHAIGIGSRAVSNRWRGLLEGLAAATDGECVIRN